MEGIRLKPKQAVLAASVSGLAVLSAACFLLPECCVLFAAVIPVIACPLVRHRQEPVCWVAAAAPAAASLMLLSGTERMLPYVLSMLLHGLLPLLVTRLVPLPRRMGARGFLWYIGTSAVSLTAVAACAGFLLDAPLQTALTDLVTARVESSPQAGLILYRLAAAGLVSVPENFPRSEILLHVLEPLMVRQMLLSFRLTLETMLANALPSAMIQGMLVTGLFTALRVDRMNGVVLMMQSDPEKPAEKKTIVAVPPGFSMLSMPGHLRTALVVMAIVSAVLMSSPGALESTVGLLMYHTFTVCFQLQGAAVASGMFLMKHPEKRLLIGILAAAVYVLAPMALFLIGVTDQVFHYRTHKVHETD